MSLNGAPLAAHVAAMVPWMQQRAGALDRAAAFPDEEIAALREAGLLAMRLPVEQPDSDSIALLADVLMELGRGNLAVGRLVEAHINARHLIARYGTALQRARWADDVRAG